MSFSSIVHKVVNLKTKLSELQLNLLMRLTEIDSISMNHDEAYSVQKSSIIYELEQCVLVLKNKCMVSFL